MGDKVAFSSSVLRNVTEIKNPDSVLPCMVKGEQRQVFNSERESLSHYSRHIQPEKLISR